jgi:hypothetical protein
MKALSIHQPWAHAILHQGKGVENRTWPTRYRGPLLIHASKSRQSYDCVKYRWVMDYECRLPAWSELAIGAIVGVVDLVGCSKLVPTFCETHGEAAKWHEGPWCWELRNPRPFTTPIPYRGAQGLFDVPDEIVKSAMSQQGAA